MARTRVCLSGNRRLWEAIGVAGTALLAPTGGRGRGPQPEADEEPDLDRLMPRYVRAAAQGHGGRFARRCFVVWESVSASGEGSGWGVVTVANGLPSVQEGPVKWRPPPARNL